MNVYFISGLGADKRIFQKLVLPGFLKPVYLDWLAPHLDESLPAYARRMSDAIDTTQPFYLIGVSFGGMIATEISKLVKSQKTILISSISTTNQLPWYYIFLGSISIDRLIPASFLTLATPLTYWIFGATDLFTKQLLKQILKDTDKRFIKWALRAILSWRNSIRPTELIQIHGTRDRILPIRFTRPTVIVPDGGHLMVYAQSDIISNVLATQLTKSS
ncbi:alpha/beta fold hydrolase [Spirosoma gilvum]